MTQVKNRIPFLPNIHHLHLLYAVHQPYSYVYILRRIAIYWIAQILGWGGYLIGNLAEPLLNDQLIFEILFTSLVIFVFGILVTHVFRAFVHHRAWTQLTLIKIIPRVLLSAVLEGILFYLLVGSLVDLFLTDVAPMLDFSTFAFVPQILNFAAIFFIWNLIYFAVHFLQNYRASQIHNLELAAAKTEAELTSFKSQLNPHFLFNSLNSIRALVDEDPEKAKSAITTLSGIMRSFLSSGRLSLISLKEEMELVENYLSIEKIRFEERLELDLNLSPDSLDTPIPPLMLQTLAENGIKHGIGKLKAGGMLSISSTLENDECQIIIRNSGTLGHENNQGIGLANTKKRLDLLFGGKAHFELKQEGAEVVVKLRVPNRKKIESA
jgi:two-component system LytT family sensor kinase